MEIWGLRAELNRDLPRMRRQFFRLKYRGIMQRRTGRFFHFLGLIPRAPNFAEFHARGGGGRLPVMPRDLIPPRGAHFSTAKQKSRPRQSGLLSPRMALSGRSGWPSGGGRRQKAEKAASAGGFLAEAGLSSGCSAEKSRRTAAEEGAGGCKSRTLRRLPRKLRSLQAPGARAKTGAGPPFSGRSQAKTRHHQAEKGRLGGLHGRPWQALGAKKPLFAAKVWPRGLCWGRKLAGRACGA